MKGNLMLMHFCRKSKVIHTKYSKHRPYTVAHTIECVCSKITHDLIHDFHFTFQAYTLTHTLNGICVSKIKFQNLNFKADLALPKTARSTQTNKSISFI